MSVFISEDDLGAVQDLLCSTLFLGHVKRLEALPADAHDHASLAAQVRLWGGWTGRVAVWMSATLARTVAAQMRGIPAADIDDEMALDVAEEIANVTAGSVKALLPSPTDMALPLIVDDRWDDIGSNAPDAVVAYFQVDTDYFSIAVIPGASRSRARRNRLG